MLTMGSFRRIQIPRGLPGRQGGTNLVEVMVALVILSIGLLGLALMQLQGLRHNTDAYLRTQATFLASDIIERMRANSAAAASYQLAAGSAPATPGTDCTSTACSAADLAAFDLANWYYNDLSNSLPAGFQASISGTSATKYVITLSWKEQISKKDQSSSNAKERNQHLGQTVTQTWSVDL
jgi:type IV pilus assembly protein PilV